MKTLEQLRLEKESIRESIRNGESGPIVGVALDSFVPEIIVIHRGVRPVAKTRLQHILNQQVLQAYTFQRWQFNRPIVKSIPRADKARRDLTPGQEIQPSKGDPGRAGYFVVVAPGRKPVVLTAGHIFHRREKEAIVCYKDKSSEYCTQIGKLEFAAGPSTDEVNRVDCATFFPTDNINLVDHDEIIDKVDFSSLKSLEGKSVKRLGGPADGKGRVIDTDAIIRYPAFVKDDWHDVTLDAQICVKDSENAFGQQGDSGAPVIVDETGHRVKRGALLGLYIVTSNHGLHFVSPIHACLNALGVAPS